LALGATLGEDIVDPPALALALRVKLVEIQLASRRLRCHPTVEAGHEVADERAEVVGLGHGGIVPRPA
jgi:hypothetical protein